MPLNLDQFKSSLVYQTTGTVKSIQMNIGELRKLDSFHEKKEKKWMWVGIGGILGILACIVGLIAFGDESDTVATTILIIGGLSLAVCILGFTVKWWYGRHNIENRRYELVHKLLNLIGKDIDKDQSLIVKIDLRPADHKSKFQRKGKVMAWDVKYYVDPWLLVRGKFMDGTAFALTMTEKHQARSKWKRNARGKYKYKTKAKTATQASLQIKPKVHKHKALSDIHKDVAGAIQLPQGVDIKGLNASPTGLSLKVALRGKWDAAAAGKKVEGMAAEHMFAMMFLSLYQVVNLAKVVSKAPSTGGAPVPGGQGAAPAAGGAPAASGGENPFAF